MPRRRRDPMRPEKPIQLVDGKTLGAKKFDTEVSRYTARRSRSDRRRHRAAARKSTRPCTCTRTLRSSITASRSRYRPFIGFAPAPGQRRLPLLDSHARLERHHPRRSAATQSAPRRPIHLGMVFDIWGQPLQPDNVAGFNGPVDGLRQRQQVRRRFEIDSAGSASADRLGGRLAGRTAAELRVPAQRLVGLAQSLTDLRSAASSSAYAISPSSR